MITDAPVGPSTASSIEGAIFFLSLFVSLQRSTNIGLRTIPNRISGQGAAVGGIILGWEAFLVEHPSHDLIAINHFAAFCVDLP